MRQRRVGAAQKMVGTTAIMVLPESLGLMLAEKVEFSIMEAIEFESKERLVTKAVGLGAINKFV